MKKKFLNTIRPNCLAGNRTMDFIARRQRREWLLLSLVSLTALMANLPRDLLHSFGLEPRFMMAVLGLVVVLALFLYLRFFFFLLYALLAVGANLPDQWAQALGIERLPLLLSLGMMIALSLINYKAKMLPSGLEPKARTQSPEGLKALLAAIEKGNAGHAKMVLAMNIDPDMPGENGRTPLTLAAERGDRPMVELLLKHGANPSLAGPDGLMPTEVALKGGHTGIFEILKARLAATAATAGPATDSRLGG